MCVRTQVRACGYICVRVCIYAAAFRYGKKGSEWHLAAAAAATRVIGSQPTPEPINKYFKHIVPQVNNFKWSKRT